MMRRWTFAQRVGAGLSSSVPSSLFPLAALLLLALHTVLGAHAEALRAPIVTLLLLLLGLSVLHGRAARLPDVAAEQAPEVTAHRVERIQGLFTAAGRVLSPLKDRESLTAALTRLCVPEAADACVLLLPHADGTLRPAAAAHTSPEEEPRLWEQARPLPLDGESCPARVLRSGRSERFPVVDLSRLPREVREGQEGEFLRAMEVRSCLLVPLAVGPRVLGVLLLLSTQPGRRYSAADQAFMEELAGRAALALDNARLTAEAQNTLELVGVAAHDLGNPLFALQLRLRRLRGLPLEGDARLGEGLAKAELEARRLGLLIHNLLDLSQLGAGRLTLEAEEMDLSALARELVDRHSEQALAAGCALTLQAAPQAQGRWDRLRLERVLTNLLSNALKFGRGAPVVVRVHDAGEHVRLCVKDHGIGIAPEAQQRIFGRFERAASGAERQAGAGLGLYIVRQLVEAHGGRIHLTSRTGEGTEFTVELPRVSPGNQAS